MPEKVIHGIRLNQYSAVPADRTRRFSLGTKDSYGIEQLRIVPGEGWDGLMITATFHPPEGEAVQVIVPADGLIDVPPEATRSGSELPIKYGKIVFAGVADGVQRISCNLPYTVMDHAPVDGAASSGPTPSWYEQAAAHFVPSGGKAGQVLAKASDADLDVEWTDGGNGTADHAKLSNRDASDQHPISAITGLENALKGKQPSGDYLTAEDLQAATDAALAQAKASGEFDGKPGPAGANGISPHIGSNGNWYTGDTDTGVSAQGPAGAPGKTAYQYAQEGGYTGTEAEFAEKLAQEMPTTLPNPNKLILSGAVTAEYDGSAEVNVEIPAGGSGSYTLPIASPTTLGGVMPAAKTDEMTQAVGVDETGGLWALPGSGGGKSWRLVRDLTLTEQTDRVDIDTDEDGNAFNLTEALVLTDTRSSSETGKQYIFLTNRGWGTKDPYLSAAVASTNLGETWFSSNAFRITAIDAGVTGYATVENVWRPYIMAAGTGHKTGIGEKYKSITTVSFVAPFDTGCRFTVFGIDK